MAGKIKVLIVDDSELVCEILTKGLAEDPKMDVTGSASDVFVAREMIIRLKPDVLTLDINMPKMDGIEFLRRLMPQYPLPVIVVSSVTQKGKYFTMQALEAGAVDFVRKPAANMAHGLKDMLTELNTKIKIASTANVSQWKGREFDTNQAKLLPFNKNLAEHTNKIIAIGASTGGVEAIRKLITSLPSNMPGIVITQHMPAGFTKTFASRLNDLSKLNVKEAESGDRILNGRVLIAPGDFQMRVVRSGGLYQVNCFSGEKVNGFRPSIDTLFISVAENAGTNSFGIILTGMGIDGVQGIKAMKASGATTYAQDEASSIVYGMPKAAFESGAVDYQFNLDDIPEHLINQIMSES